MAETRIQQHLDSWLSESDFAQIRDLGFNSVRLPIGYWNILSDPFGIFVPQDPSVSLRYIDWTFDMADRYNLTVLLDLHGVPGSQNGIDHSGCSMPATWLESDKNQQLTIDAIEAMVKRYGSRKSFLGVELVNEPSLHYSQDMHPQLLSFYRAAYKAVRAHSRDCLVVFNELYAQCYSMWSTELQEPEYYNVVMDLHLYDWQEPFTGKSKQGHVKDGQAFAQVVQSLSTQHPVIVGEWSFSTGTHVQAGQPFVDACVQSFSHGGMGWYIWNWKIQRGAGFDEWDVQFQAGLKGGMHALSYIDSATSSST